VSYSLIIESKPNPDIKGRSTSVKTSISHAFTPSEAAATTKIKATNSYVFIKLNQAGEEQREMAS
ncbi:hypothetical protein ACMD2_04656, partial [Ananas comosus]